MSDRHGNTCTRLPVVELATERDAQSCLWCRERDGLVRIAEDAGHGTMTVITACLRCIEHIAEEAPRLTDAPGPADARLLAAGNRALVERVERLETNATAREGVTRRQLDQIRAAQRERDKACAALEIARETLLHLRGYVADRGLSAEGDVDEALRVIDALGGKVERGGALGWLWLHGVRWPR